MNGKSTGMVGETPHARVVYGHFEYPKQNVWVSFSFVATYSDLPLSTNILANIYFSIWKCEFVNNIS